MIHRLLVENFFSFKEATEVNFAVPKGTADQDIYHTDHDGTRLNSVLAIFGANASGKTNLLKAIGFLHWFICHSASQKPGEQNILGTPFHFLRQPDPAWKLELEFSYAGHLYRYRLRSTNERVLDESLHVKKARFKYVFERNWNPKRKQYDAKFQDFGNHALLPLRENASLISTAVLQENSLAMALNKHFESFYGNTGVFGRKGRHDPDPPKLYRAARYFEENPKVLAAVNRHLRGADLGLAEVVVSRFSFFVVDGRGRQETMQDTIEETIPIARHEVAGEKYDNPLIHESRGTQALFLLLRYVLPVLENGGVAYIDELESSLHPHIIREIVRLFYSRRTNPKQAQLVFTCHSDYLLTELSKYQIVLVEKDDSLVSHAWRLDTMQGVRASENIHAKYHAGAYGAIPDL